MAPDGSASRVAVLCGAKDCRTAPGHAALARELATATSCQLIESRCLDVCKGPVVVVGFGEDRPVVLRKVRGAKARRKLIEFVAGGPLSGRLSELEVSGARRRTALRRVRPR